MPRTGASKFAALSIVAALATTSPARAQKVFPTPEAAVDALVAGLARHDNAAAWHNLALARWRFKRRRTSRMRRFPCSSTMPTIRSPVLPATGPGDPAKAGP